MNPSGYGARFDRQAGQYAFPYHWLPSRVDGTAAIGRTLPWGLEYLAVLETTADFVSEERPRRVLDVGCGDGRLAIELAERGVAEVVGVDLVEQAIAFARAFGVPFGTRVHFECLPVQDLDAGVFDAAVLMEVLEHIPADALHEVVEATRARLRVGGRLIVSVPTTNVPVIAKHERHYTEALLREHVGPGFQVESVRYVHRASAANRLLRRLFTNRVASLEERHLRGTFTALYHRVGLEADPRDGVHLAAVFRRL